MSPLLILVHLRQLMHSWQRLRDVKLHMLQLRAISGLSSPLPILVTSMIRLHKQQSKHSLHG